uniref:Uncharacterized protein n=1 Tax=Anas platyrhynchos TaxID=8839 RepID=A0A8B9ZG62_ANAPL
MNLPPNSSEVALLLLCKALAKTEENDFQCSCMSTHSNFIPPKAIQHMLKKKKQNLHHKLLYRHNLLLKKKKKEKDFSIEKV